MLPAIPNPELFFGLCSPLGTNNKQVSAWLEESLKALGYNTEYIKLTDSMKNIRIVGLELKETPIDIRYDSYIRYANKIREELNLPYALAILACFDVRRIRRERSGDSSRYIQKQSYIFDQLKRKEEISLLRQVYGRLFVSVSIYSSKTHLTARLAERISEDHGSSRPNEEYRSIASKLVERDEVEEGDLNGQRLQEAFPSADLFIDVDDENAAKKLIKRFLEALFGSNYTSPTREEYGMYLARNSALRSADLSRQVGAALISGQGEVITLGCNEVPKAGGGTYWTEDTKDFRDMKRGADSNERIKRSMIVDLVKRMKSNKFLVEGVTTDDVVKFIEEQTARDGPLRDAQVMDLIEFGRIITEMSAICDAARLGKSLKDSVLYCTTFPCHICAKHILAAGVGRVVFIEPYPKSYAERLHDDAISVGGEEQGKIPFKPFIGVSPYRYRDLFERARRKDDSGKVVDWVEEGPTPNIRYTAATYVQNELAVMKIFRDRARVRIAAGAMEVDGIEERGA